MEIRTTRQTEEKTEVSILIVYISEDRYTLKETNDGRLQINKVSDGESDLIKIHPRSGNEIELS